MENTVKEQETKTTEVENKSVEEVKTPETETKVEQKQPYKTFATQKEFDDHSAGILNSAKNKAEKELLAMLGLKPDEKDKLAKFKEAYESTLSESEKQIKSLEELGTKVKTLEATVAEKDAIIAALVKMSGKTTDDVSKYVKMAKGLVDDNTTIEQALEQVLEFTKTEPKSNSVPSGKPLAEPNGKTTEDNPFKTGNLTEQGKLINADREKARAMYYAVNGKYPSW